MDDIVDKIKTVNFGCYFSLICTCIFLCADNIVLLAPAAVSIHVCEKELEQLDMKINVSKYVYPILFQVQRRLCTMTSLYIRRRVEMG